MRPRLWHGFHSPELSGEIARAWNGGEPLVLVPPALKDLTAFSPQLDDLPDGTAFGIFTSGSVGQKLILYRRENIEASLAGIFSFFELDRIDTVFCYPQPFHVFGLSLGYLFAQLYGKTLIAPPGPYSGAAHEAWLRHIGTGTLTLGTPTHFRDLIGFVNAAGVRPGASYSAILGGAPVPRSLWLDARDRLSIQAPSIGYGASELSPGATHLAPGREPRENYELGVALPNVTLEIHPGQGLRVRGPNVCAGIVENGTISTPSEIWLRDEARRREDGTLVFLHRNDLFLNRGGEKFFLEEIEKLLRSRLGVEAAGVGVPHGRLGEELGLLLRGADLPKERIYGVLKDAYAREFDPTLCFFVDELPRGGTAKVDRQRCREYIEERRVSH